MLQSRTCKWLSYELRRLGNLQVSLLLGIRLLCSVQRLRYRFLIMPNVVPWGDRRFNLFFGRKLVIASYFYGGMEILFVALLISSF